MADKCDKCGKIPATIKYKDKGWVNWGDFLGTEKSD